MKDNIPILGYLNKVFSALAFNLTILQTVQSSHSEIWILFTFLNVLIPAKAVFLSGSLSEDIAFNF